MSLFRYKAFGLNIESEIEMPELLLTNEEPDVFICFGVVPELINPRFKGVRFEASPDHFLLKVDGIAQFYAESGNKITIEPYGGSEETDIRLFLLGSVFGAIIHQRGMLPMHGSSISVAGKAFIFSGISGSGKSTIAAGLINRGYKLLSDDISVITINESNLPFVYSGYPGLKLWEDTLLKLGRNPENYARVRSRLNKHHLFVGENYQTDAIILGGVYIVHTRNTAGIELETLRGIEKFNALKNNTYRLNFIKGLGNTEAHFRHLTALASNCRVMKITRSTKTFFLEELLDIIEQDLNSFHGNA